MPFTTITGPDGLTLGPQEDSYIYCERLSEFSFSQKADPEGVQPGWSGY
jgi:hypothetical protein